MTRKELSDSLVDITKAETIEDAHSLAVGILAALAGEEPAPAAQPVAYRDQP